MFGGDRSLNICILVKFCSGQVKKDLVGLKVLCGGESLKVLCGEESVSLPFLQTAKPCTTNSLVTTLNLKREIYDKRKSKMKERVTTDY